MGGIDQLVQGSGLRQIETIVVEATKATKNRAVLLVTESSVILNMIPQDRRRFAGAANHLNFANIAEIVESWLIEFEKCEMPTDGSSNQALGLRRRPMSSSASHEHDLCASLGKARKTSLRCLIIGADGTFGAALAEALRRGGHEVIATTRRRHLTAVDGSFYLELAEELPSMPEADIAIICAAMARFEDCRRFPELAYRVNVAAPLELGRSLTQAGARVILLSTSVVFNCLQPHVSERERPMPRSAYGRLKAEAEARLLELGSLVSVLRLTKVVKPNAGHLSEWIQALGEGKVVRAFDDHCFSPLTVAHVVDALVALIERGESGIYHVSGAKDVSYADSARFFARQIGASGQLVEALRGVDNGLAEDDLTPFTSLATTRLSDLTGFVPPEPLEVLQSVYGLEIDQAREMLTARAR